MITLAITAIICLTLFAITYIILDMGVHIHRYEHYDTPSPVAIDEEEEEKQLDQTGIMDMQMALQETLEEVTK